MRDPNKPVPRGVYILPNLFTTASLFAGFLSITLAISGDFDNAAWAILFSALMDGLDGKVADSPDRPASSAWNTIPFPTP